MSTSTYIPYKYTDWKVSRKVVLKELGNANPNPNPILQKAKQWQKRAMTLGREESTLISTQ